MEKSLLLAEKGNLEKDNEVELLTAGKKFRILATMNPGGDFGKKEVKTIFFFFFPLLFRAAPVAYGCSQDRG